jgi:hypothetical protein
MKRCLKQLSLLAVVVVSCMVMTLSVATTPSAHAATHTAHASNLGGIDLRSYCRSLGYTNEAIVGTTIYDWRCVNADGSQANIDMTNACRWQYGPGAIDYSNNFYVATSVSCANAPTLLGGINLKWYCQLIGYANVTTVGTTAYDWRCVKADGTLVTVNMAWACVYQYGTAIAMSRFANFYSVTSWQCWK